MDTLKFAIQDESLLGTRIKVIGVGGGGGNAVARMMAEGLRLYRSHVTNELLAWARSAAGDARRAVDDDRRDDVRANIDRLELAARQLGRIAEQEGARPDYGLHEDVHVEAP